jgi:hypothetical protein
MYNAFNFAESNYKHGTWIIYILWLGIVTIWYNTIEIFILLSNMLLIHTVHQLPHTVYAYYVNMVCQLFTSKSYILIAYAYYVNDNYIHLIISNHTLSYELSMQIIKNRYYTILICMPVYIWYNRTHLSYILQRILTCVRASYMWNMSINTYGIHIYHIL